MFLSMSVCMFRVGDDTTHGRPICNMVDVYFLNRPNTGMVMGNKYV